MLPIEVKDTRFVICVNNNKASRRQRFGIEDLAYKEVHHGTPNSASLEALVHRETPDLDGREGIDGYELGQVELKPLRFIERDSVIGECEVADRSVNSFVKDDARKT